MSVFNPIYGMDNVTYAVVIPPKVLDKKLNRTKFVRSSGGEIWRDKTLEQWPLRDCRLFIGDLGQDVTDTALTEALRSWKGFNMARVVMNRLTKKCKGYGFASFATEEDAMAVVHHQRAQRDLIMIGARYMVFIF